MPPKCGRCSAPEPRARRWRELLYAAPTVLAVSGCSPQQAEVGSAWPPISDGGVGGGDAAFTFFTDFASNGGLWGGRNGSGAFGIADPGAGDRNVAEIRFPGQTGLAPTDRAGPFYATEISSSMRFHFGTYRTSLAVPRCPADQGAISAMFVFSNDGSDANHNGIADNDEIDVQFLCGSPSAIYLTVWTDFEQDDGGRPLKFIKLRRIVDFATGDIYDSASDTTDDYVKTGNEPSFLRPGFPAPSVFYEMGFDWRANAVRFFIVLDGAESTLWTLTDPTHIPQSTASIMYNMWHPSEHWHPRTGPAAYPTQDVVFRVDWFGHRAD